MTEVVMDAEKKIDNRFVWGLSLVNVAWFIFDCLSVNDYFTTAVVIVANTTLMVIDSTRLKDRGYKTPLAVLGMVFLPLYLIQRAYVLKDKDKPFYALCWLLTFVLFFWYGDKMDYNKKLEVTACEVVTDIIKQNYHEDGVTCQRVKIDEKVTDGFYKAHAIVSDGTSINIGIEDKENDEIYVTLSSY